jgi:hypothetical protein
MGSGALVVEVEGRASISNHLVFGSLHRFSPCVGLLRIEDNPP